MHYYDKILKNKVIYIFLCTKSYTLICFYILKFDTARKIQCIITYLLKSILFRRKYKFIYTYNVS